MSAPDISATTPKETALPSPAPRQPLSVRVLRTILPLGILAAGVFGAVAIYGLKAEPESVDVKELPPLVQTVALEPHTAGLAVDVDGIVVPHREIVISAEVAGRILAKDPRTRAGNYVDKGQRLLTIDPRDYELDKERLTKEYKQAETVLEELDVEYANVESLVRLGQEDLALQRRELERVQKLANVVGDSEVDRVKRAELASRNAVVQLENQLRAIETKRSRLVSGKELVAAQLEKAERDLARTTVEAPIDGVIISEMVEQDSYVQKGAELLTLEDTSAVEVRCQLRMEELYWLWRHQSSQSADSEDEAARDYEIPQTPATIVYQVGRERFAWKGMLSRFDGLGLDEKTRTIPCRVLVTDPRQVDKLDEQGRSTGVPIVGPPALLRGMYVSVQLHTQPDTNLFRIPDEALRPNLSKPGGNDTAFLNAIWIVRDGKLIVEPVDVAGVVGKEVIVTTHQGRLRAGDRVVVTPLGGDENGGDNIHGMTVRLQDEEAEESPAQPPAPMQASATKH